MLAGFPAPVGLSSSKKSPNLSIAILISISGESSSWIFIKLIDENARRKAQSVLRSQPESGHVPLIEVSRLPAFRDSRTSSEAGVASPRSIQTFWNQTSAVDSGVHL